MHANTFEWHTKTHIELLCHSHKWLRLDSHRPIQMNVNCLPTKIFCTLDGYDNHTLENQIIHNSAGVRASHTHIHSRYHTHTLRFIPWYSTNASLSLDNLLAPVMLLLFILTMMWIMCVCLCFGRSSCVFAYHSTLSPDPVPKILRQTIWARWTVPKLEKEWCSS